MAATLTLIGHLVLLKTMTWGSGRPTSFQPGTRSRMLKSKPLTDKPPHHSTPIGLEAGPDSGRFGTTTLTWRSAEFV
jgi:hypothetical protein